MLQDGGRQISAEVQKVSIDGEHVHTDHAKQKQDEEEKKHGYMIKRYMNHQPCSQNLMC